jgi:hypothetical protein
MEKKKQKKWSSQGQNKMKMPHRSNKKGESKKHNKRKERYYNSDSKSLEL